MSPQGPSPARALGTLSVPEQKVLVPVFPLLLRIWDPGLDASSLSFGEHQGPLIPPEHHQDLQHLATTEIKAWSVSCLEMLALTSSCLSFPISAVAGVSHPPLVSVPCPAQGAGYSSGLGRTHRASGRCRTPGMVCETLGWNLHQRVFNSSLCFPPARGEMASKPWFVSVRTRVPGACPK